MTRFTCCSVLVLVSISGVAGCMHREPVTRTPDDWRTDVGRLVEARAPELRKCFEEHGPKDKTKGSVVVGVGLYTHPNRKDAYETISPPEPKELDPTKITVRGAAVLDTLPWRDTWAEGLQSCVAKALEGMPKPTPGDNNIGKGWFRIFFDLDVPAGTWPPPPESAPKPTANITTGSRS